MRFTGLAIGDAVTLEREKIKWYEPRKVWRVVTSRAKTGVNVSVPIPPDVAEELLAVATATQSTSSGTTPVVSPKPQPRTGARSCGAGLPDGHSHQLRDTAGVEWLNAGIPLEEVEVAGPCVRPDGGKTLRPVGQVTPGPAGRSRDGDMGRRDWAESGELRGSEENPYGFGGDEAQGRATNEQRSELAGLLRQANERLGAAA